MELLEHRLEKSEVGIDARDFEDLYETAFPPFARFAARMNASFEDARDIFQDALVLWIEKCQHGDPVVRISPQAYIMGIGKHLWFKKFHRDRSKIVFTDMEQSISIPEGYYPTVNEMRLLDILERSGKKCLELLRRFYYDGKGLKDITVSLGYRTEHSASVQKYKCIAKLRQFIRKKALNYEDFFI